MQMLTNERAELKILHGGMADNSGGGIDDDGERKSRKIQFTTRRIFQIRGSPYGSFGVLCPRGWQIYIGRKTPHIYINQQYGIIDVTPFTFTNGPK